MSLLPRTGGAHFPWWAGLVLGLGLALLIAIVLCILVCGFALRWRRRERTSNMGSLRDVESAKVCFPLASCPFICPCLPFDVCFWRWPCMHRFCCLPSQAGCLRLCKRLSMVHGMVCRPMKIVEFF